MAPQTAESKRIVPSNPTLFLMVGVVIFTLGILAGFLLSGRLGQFLDPSAVQIMPSGGVNWLPFWGYFGPTFAGCCSQLCWPCLRWAFFCSIRFFFCGEYYWVQLFSLFAQGSRLSVFLHFFFTALLTCAPLLLEAVSGMLRGSSELYRYSPDESGIFSHPVFPLAVLLAGAGLIVLCCIAELWLLPSFVAHIQSFTQ